MLPNIHINLYCNKCGKIVTSFFKPRPLREAEEYIKKWLECPYCIECVIEKMKEN